MNPSAWSPVAVVAAPAVKQRQSIVIALFVGAILPMTDDTLRQIALWRLESFTAEEIAERLLLSTRSVERKLRLIRDIWRIHLESGG